MVLAINYQPKASTPDTWLQQNLVNACHVLKVDLSTDLVHPSQLYTRTGDDGLPEGVGDKAGHQDHLLPGMKLAQSVSRSAVGLLSIRPHAQQYVSVAVADA